MEEGLALLNGKDIPSGQGHNAEYFKSWLAIKFLIEIEKVSAEDIFRTDLVLDEIFSRAVKFYSLP